MVITLGGDRTKADIIILVTLTIRHVDETDTEFGSESNSTTVAIATAKCHNPGRTDDSILVQYFISEA